MSRRISSAAASILTVCLLAASAPAAHAASVNDPECRVVGFGCTSGGYSSQDFGGWVESRFGWGAARANPADWAGFDGHNCTRYAAYRLRLNGLTADPIPSNVRWGHAAAWDDTVRTYLGADKVNQTAAVGAIAQWEGTYGHVAYVEAVEGTRIRVTEDSYGGGTSARTIDLAQNPGIDFIHLADVPQAPAAPAPLSVGWTNYPGTAKEVAFATITGGWELFHLGTDNVIYRKILRGGTLSGWQAIGGPRAKKIAATTSSDGRVELFYIGMNDQVYHHWESSPGGSIANWEGLGGYAVEIAAARSGGGWEVYHVGGSQSMWRATQGDHSWRRLAGAATSISAATSRDGRVELFHVGGGNVYHAWQSSPGSAMGAWVNMGGGSMSHVGASSVGNGEFEVFAVSADGRLWRQAPWSGVGTWQALTGSASKVAAAKNPDGRVEVAHVGGGGSMWHAWQRSVGAF